MWARRVQKANAKKYLRCQKLTTVCLVESVCSRVRELKGKCQRGRRKEGSREREECWELRTFLAAARSGNLTLSFALAKCQVAAAALSLLRFLPAECAPPALTPLRVISAYFLMALLAVNYVVRSPKPALPTKICN